PLRESFDEERCTPCRADESLTQDSRSAVGARLIDPLRESFGGEHCTHRVQDVMAFQRPSRGSEPSITRRDAARTQRRCRCARTSLAVTTRAKRYAYALRPHATSRGRAQGSRHTSGAKTFAQHAPPIGGDLWMGSDEGRRRLRCSPGAATTQVATLD